MPIPQLKPNTKRAGPVEPGEGAGDEPRGEYLVDGPLPDHEGEPAVADVAPHAAADEALDG